MTDIIDVAKSLGINKENLVLYGNDKAKILSNGSNSNGKLILVTATSPTPSGEGKTTVSIGLSDALKKLNKKIILTLREPSMGPVFGMKGGATGGGKSQVVPMEDINLHFTGDFHAITSANNLICAAIDNHVEKGNSLGISKVLFKRCLDVNDRTLRKINTKYGETGFNITAASEIMSILSLANDIDDLRERLFNIIIGIDKDNKYVYLKDLNIVGSLLVLLKDAFLPNLVKTLENTPTIIHGGPFANIAHGCNSVIGTKTALSYADYVVTEAGFGSDLGAEKFFDIKCRESNLKPDCVVLVTTVKSLKYHSNNNLKIHYDNMKKFNSNVIVCLNRFDTDTEEDINSIKEYCMNNSMPFTICNSYHEGSDGSVELANLVLETIKKDNSFNYLYDTNLSIEEKVNIISKEIYRATNVEYDSSVIDKINIIKDNNLSHLPICVSKTQYSLSDDPKKINISDYNIRVTDINVYNGAGFITVYLGDVVTMPGLPKDPNYEKIDYKDNEVIGLK
ncbi:MAG: formate--tetrahydrofolate ligase [Bacilli bacterium]|nr:formate--tetrahydrofolate ligase [Bacilli bacterium]MBR3049466.1 formate--tetrahydrofolate ligase [Bacilli bacterium]